MSLIYYETCVEAECHDCGERTTCTRMTADRPCPETGYVDEIELCNECMQKRWPYDPWN